VIGHAALGGVNPVLEQMGDGSAVAGRERPEMLMLTLLDSG
jgi:hypothetical protein